MKELVYSIPWVKITISAVIAVFSLLLWRFVGVRGTNYKLKSGHKEATTLIRVGFSVLRWLVLICALLVILQIFGVNVSAAFAGLGIVSAAVALALQDMLKDVIMGIHIMSDRFFSVGDGVIYNGEEGIVCGFTLKTTKIKRLADGSVIVISNRLIEQITQLSHLVDLDVSVAYSSEPELVMRTMDRIAERLSKVEGVDSAENKGLQDFGSSALLYRLRFFSSPEKKYELRRAALSIIQEEFGTAGIEIPFDQLDVHLDR